MKDYLTDNQLLAESELAGRTTTAAPLPTVALHEPPVSPEHTNGAVVDPSSLERSALLEDYRDLLVVRPSLTRKIVSYQGNKAQPGLRWMRYKEGFSTALVKSALQKADGPVLDPFGGTGTASLTAAASGRPSYSLELLPVGIRCAKAIMLVASSFSRSDIEVCGEALMQAARKKHKVDTRFCFPHVPITQLAFPEETEEVIARTRCALDEIDNPDMQLVLDVACMSVLEDVSYTRKDGQYLRWDHRSGRSLKARWHKGEIAKFDDALQNRLEEIAADAEELKNLYDGKPAPVFIQGSALNKLATLKNQSIGLTITSPPYANRYDYTRTYALELAWLGYDKSAFSALRQNMLTATVENRSKETWLAQTHPDTGTLRKARIAVEKQAALREVIESLNAVRTSLNNPQIIRLVTNYFCEMGLVIAELARLTIPGGRVVMVNDNVQYHGEEIPVDLILSEIAETLGFECEEISVLQCGKGNASQQMGRFGRRELRKCVYQWKIPDA